MIREHNGTKYDLAPCPFCGRDIAQFVTCQEVEACSEFSRCTDGHYLTVVCSIYDQGCGSSSGFYPTAAEAAGKWNHRARTIPLDEMLDLIKKNTYSGDASDALSGSQDTADRREPVQNEEASQSALQQP